MRDYQDMVFSTAYRLLADRAEAEDISQEVFLKAYTHFDGLRQSSTAGGWLKTVTRNLCLTHLTRRRWRWKLFSEFGGEEDDGELPLPDQLSEPATATDQAEAADRRELLSAALEKLPAPQRVALVLYHFHDLSYEDIAAQLKVSLSKVKIDIHRARLALRQRLEHNRHTLLAE